MTPTYAPVRGSDLRQGPLSRFARRLGLRHERRSDFEPRPLHAEGALQPIRYADYRSAADRRYLKRRWPYYREAIGMATRLAPQRVLEIGCRHTPLFPASDRLDYAAEFDPTFHHDATVVPWPISDQAYDLVIALQVWEHLGDRQREAFSELPRISRYAILSLPFKWRRKNNPSHSGIDDAVISRWTGGLAPLETVQLPLVGRRRRKIYLFDLREAI